MNKLFIKNKVISILSKKVLSVLLPKTKTGLNIGNFLNLSNIDTNKPLELTIDLPIPINIHFRNNIGISTDKNMMIATGGELHLNPYDERVDKYIDFTNLNTYIEALKSRTKELKEVNHSGCTCGCNENYTASEFELLSKTVTTMHEQLIELGMYIEEQRKNR